MPAFVVLQHTAGPSFDRDAIVGRVHFDWMFQQGDALWTWASECIENIESSYECDCQRLKDHRSAYLEIEGDIGGGRGFVERVLQGEYTAIECDDDQFRADLQFHADLRGTDSAGNVVNQRIRFHRTLSAGPSDLWRLRLGW